MKATGQCPKCGGTDIIADALAVDRGDGTYEHEMAVATFRRPEALIFKERQETPLSAWVCAECGFVELYADRPAGIKVPPKP